MIPAAIVLAGGKSRRMGRDKVALVLQGRTLLQWVLLPLQRACEDVIVVGREVAGVHCLPDPPGLPGQGPLAAVVAGLRALAEAGRTQTFLFGCDSPFCDERLLTLLSGTMASAGRQAVLPRSEQGLQPLCSAIMVAPALQVCENLLARGERRLISGFELLSRRELAPEELPDPRVLWPCNSPEDWAAIVTSWESRAMLGP